MPDISLDFLGAQMAQMIESQRRFEVKVDALTQTVERIEEELLVQTGIVLRLEGRRASPPQLPQRQLPDVDRPY